MVGIRCEFNSLPSNTTENSRTYLLSSALCAFCLGRNVLRTVFHNRRLGLRRSLLARFVQLLIVEGYLGRLDQAEPLKSIIQHSKLLDRQISINLDHDSPHSYSCRHRDLGHRCVSSLVSHRGRTSEPVDKFRLLLWFPGGGRFWKRAGRDSNLRLAVVSSALIIWIDGCFEKT